MKTVMDYWCEFTGWQGGTIHQALYEFKHNLSWKDKDKFCGVICDNISNISDKHHARDFMHARLNLRNT